MFGIAGAAADVVAAVLVSVERIVLWLFNLLLFVRVFWFFVNLVLKTSRPWYLQGFNFFSND